MMIGQNKNGACVMDAKKHQVIPGNENKCAWMGTGLISYKLCTHNYQCETCMFDRVMRNDFTTANVLNRSCDESAFESNANLHEALFFNRQHCWARVENPALVRIGIDSILTNFVVKVRAVSLPKPGEAVKQGSVFAHIIQDKHVLELISPVSGIVSAVNALLYKSPEMIIDDSWESGWLIAVQPDSMEHDLQNLLFGKKAKQWYEQCEQSVIETVGAMLETATSSLGPTMQDGGEQVSSLADMLSAEQYCQVIESLTENQTET
jgi:glycine cleavage system H lipoate-binding protein